MGEVAKLALQAGSDVDKLSAMPYPGTDGTVADHLRGLVATIGENISLRRTATLDVENGVVASYVHNQATPGMGKIGVLVAIEISRRCRKAERDRPADSDAYRRDQPACAEGRGCRS